MIKLIFSRIHTYLRESGGMKDSTAWWKWGSRNRTCFG